MDPYFHGNVPALGVIGKAREVALQRLSAGEPITDVMRTFIKQSRILEMDLGHLGMAPGENLFPVQPIEAGQ